MKINVGSKNAVKIEAVKETVSNYDFLSSAEIIPVEASSGVAAQPKSMDETIRGAMNRARNAFNDCSYSVGMEDGIMDVPYTKTGHMNICVCAIYDGRNFHIGLASAYEYPPAVTRMIFEGGLDINQAFHKAGLTANKKVGSSEGAIGILTKGKLTRKEYSKQAVVMALIHLQNSGLF